MSRASLASRLESLRAAMREHDVDLYVVPSADPHQSEYPPACWKRREAISGFTGSAGIAVIGLEQAWLVTDSRYWLQAERELEAAAWGLVRQGAPGVPDFPDWLRSVARDDGRVGVDPATISLDQEASWRKALDKRGATLVAIEDNLVDRVWKDRSPPPLEPVRIQPERLSGEPPTAKLARLRAALEEEGCAAHVVTALDAIAWLFDLRGADVPFNPVCVAWAIVERERATLFVDAAKLDETVRRHLPPDVTVRRYEDFAAALDAARDRVWLDPATASAWVKGRLASATLHEAPSPITLMKARKNAVELDGARAAHVRDGVALVRFLAWLEAEAPKGSVTELSAAARLEAFRAEGEHYRGLSFETISAMGDHGAIVHYRPDDEGHRVVDGSSLYLLDSGAQYLDGTTDVTRTIALGEPTSEQRDRFTRVLRGHIALARATFPEKTSGKQLDAFARAPLWDAGLNYGHGTGHGVGSYLNVHEGPHRIAPTGSDVALEPGMIVSNEPGYYEAGAWGIRIESLVAVVERAELGGDGRRFFGFETLTLCPIDRGLIDREALLPAERKWLDDYHARVRGALSPHLDSREREWLARATEPL